LAETLAEEIVGEIVLGMVAEEEEIATQIIQRRRIPQQRSWRRKRFGGD
jgi:hypothetical protein